MLRSAALNHVAVLVTAMLGMSPQPSAAAPVAFHGEKTTWHGFDRFDFLMDEMDLRIKPSRPRRRTQGP